MTQPAWITAFPTLQQTVYGKPLIYLDNAATTQKPLPVLEALNHYYTYDNANVHRGVHALSQRADKAYEKARITAQQFFHAKHAHEIIFTYGTTDAINLLAHTLSEGVLRAGDEIIISQAEHHANIVPWQRVCEKLGCILKVAPLASSGRLDFDAFLTLLSPRTRLVSITMTSNVLGIRNPVEAIIQAAHAVGAWVILDAAQAAAHEPIDVQALDVDFLVCSAHKLYGPTGVGLLYGKTDRLEQLPPYRTGGGMIDEVSFAKTTYAPLPYKFEAGTPPISAVIGFGAALEFLLQIGFAAIQAHEQMLSNFLWAHLSSVPGLRCLGEFENRAPLVSFVLDGAHAHDVATILDRQGIAVRAGHHCAMPLMDYYGVMACTRVSAGLYNTEAELAAFVHGLSEVKKVMCDV